MERYARSILNTYLELYVERFRKEQLSLKVLSGEGTLTDVYLNPMVLNNELGMPPCLRIKRAYSPKVKLHVAATQLKKKPLRVEIPELFLDIYEPEHLISWGSVAPAPKKQQEPAVGGGSSSSSKKKAKKKNAEPEYGLAERVADGLNLTVDLLHIKVILRGTEKGPPPILHLTLSHIKLASTDAQWRERDLDVLWASNKGQQVITTYRLVTVDALSVHLEPPPPPADKAGGVGPAKAADLVHIIHPPIPLQVKIILRKQIRTGNLLSLDVSWALAPIRIALLQPHFHMLLSGILAFIYCLQRLDVDNPTAEAEDERQRLIRELAAKYQRIADDKVALNAESKLEDQHLTNTPLGEGSESSPFTSGSTISPPAGMLEPEFQRCRILFTSLLESSIIADRRPRYHTVQVSHCFVGADFVSWVMNEHSYMLASAPPSREEASQLGQLLLDSCFVQGSHTQQFNDDGSLYRCLRDDTVMSSSMVQTPSAGQPTPRATGGARGYASAFEAMSSPAATSAATASSSATLTFTWVVKEVLISLMEPEGDGTAGLGSLDFALTNLQVALTSPEGSEAVEIAVALPEFTVADSSSSTNGSFLLSKSTGVRYPGSRGSHKPEDTASRMSTLDSDILSCQGWLTKAARTIASKSQKRWFELSDTVLSYCNAPGLPVKVSLDITLFDIVRVSRNVLALKPRPKSKMRKYTLTAEDDSTCDMWLSVLTRASAGADETGCSDAGSAFNKTAQEAFSLAHYTVKNLDTGETFPLGSAVDEVDGPTKKKLLRKASQTAAQETQKRLSSVTGFLLSNINSGESFHVDDIRRSLDKLAEFITIGMTEEGAMLRASGHTYSFIDLFVVIGPYPSQLDVWDVTPVCPTVGELFIHPLSLRLSPSSVRKLLFWLDGAMETVHAAAEGAENLRFIPPNVPTYVRVQIESSQVVLLSPDKIKNVLIAFSDGSEIDEDDDDDEEEEEDMMTLQVQKAACWIALYLDERPSSSSPGTNDVFNDDVWQAPDVESSVAPRMVPFNIALPTLTPGDVNLWTTDANCGKKFEFQVHEFVVHGSSGPLYVQPAMNLSGMLAPPSATGSRSVLEAGGKIQGTIPLPRLVMPSNSSVADQQLPYLELCAVCAPSMFSLDFHNVRQVTAWLNAVAEVAEQQERFSKRALLRRESLDRSGYINGEIQGSSTLTGMSCSSRLNVGLVEFHYNLAPEDQTVAGSFRRTSISPTDEDVEDVLIIQEMKVLKDNFANSQHSLNRAREEVQKLTSRIASSPVEAIAAQQAEITALRKELAASQLDCKSLKTDFESLDAQHDTQKRMAASSTQELDMRREESKRLTSQVMALTKQMAEIEFGYHNQGGAAVNLDSALLLDYFGESHSAMADLASCAELESVNHPSLLIRCGWLYVRSNKDKSVWKSRFFKVSHGLLSYGFSDTKVQSATFPLFIQASDVLPQSTYEVTGSPDDVSPAQASLCFVLEPTAAALLAPGSKNKRLILSALSQHDCQAWCSAISTAAKVHQEVLSVVED